MSSLHLRVLVLMLISLPLVGFDSVPHDSVEIMPHWRKGDSFGLVISRTREKSVDGQSTVSGKTQTHVTIEVLRADPNGYLIGWTSGDTTFEAPTPSESFLRQLVGLMKGLQIIVQIDPHGTIIGVQNWKELRHETRHVLDTLLAKTPDSPKGGTDYSLLSNLRAQWDKMFGTQEQVEQLCTRDARMYFMALGKQYIQGKPLEYEDHLPNPLGGEPFPAHTTIALKAFNKQSGHALLTKRQSTTAQQASRILDSMMREMSARQGKNVPERQFPKAIAMEDHADVEIDVNTGWVTRLTRTQSVNLGTRGQTDITSFIRVAK